MLKRAVLCLFILTLAGSAWAQSAVLINAAGSTFGYPIYSKWFDEYSKIHPNAHINYASIGSGGGIHQLFERTVDFGASDAPLDDKQLADAPFQVLHFPTVLGGTVPFYNIPGVKVALKFTPQALAGIYLGTITKWNDSAITGPNPGVNLPNADIIVVHRAEGSGTTYCWTDYLSKVSPAWREKVGRNISVNWPVGLGGKGSEGVTGLVEQTPYSIGYVELIYALQNHISYGLVENSDGIFLKATLAGVTAAAATAKMPPDFRVSITNAPGRAAYPISTFTWYLVPTHIADPVRRQIIKNFLRWMLTAGQKDAAPLGYAPLPHNVVTEEIRQISLIH